MTLRQQCQMPSFKRPVSDDFTEAVPPQYNTRRRLSDIAEERRASMPSELLRKELERFQSNNNSN